MDVTFTPEQEELRKTVLDFMAKECPDHYLRDLDQRKEFPHDLYNKWVKQEWLSLPFPEEYGGINANATTMMVFAEAIGASGYDIGVVYSENVFTGLNILRFGTEEQKARYLPGLIDGSIHFAVGFTEPEAGSDAANIKTKAVADGDDFVINGQKVFCTMGHIPNAVILMAVRTDSSGDKHQGISFLLVPNTAPGLEIRRLNLLGRNLSGTTEIFITDVRVPKSNLLGPLHDGWRQVLRHHGTARLFLSALYIGHGQTILREATEYAMQREQFGQAIGKFQVVSHMLADMATEIEATRWLVYRAASLLDKGLPAIKEISMAKLFGSEMLLRAANTGMQIMGGYGYSMESNMQRHLRDARIVTIAGGSSQIQRNVIARQMGIK